MSSQVERAPSAGSPEVIAGRFEIRGFLFEDGFGEVLDGFDRKTQKAITLRKLRQDAVVAKVRAELRALGSFNHPNVVAGFGVVASAHDALLVQGPLAGQHLAQYMAARREGGRPVSLRGAYNVVAHVCNALTALHAYGPHGAVRPGAVWIGDAGRVQLADFVIARAHLLGLGPGALTTLPEAEVAYLAPELKAGQPPVPASDVFGLGALLYVLLTCRSPQDAFVPPSQAHPEATPAVDAELMRALAADPRARHASADAFRAALLGLLGNAAPETADDFGVEVEVEVNLASLPPSHQPGRRSTGEISVEIPPAPRLPQIPAQAPEAGTRVSLEQPFRPSSIEVDASELDAARERRSLGEVDLKDVLAKITEDDAPRWMVVKNGMDHGPFSGRQLVNMIVQGEALRDHELLNSDTGRRGTLGEFPEFQDFLAQYELRRAEAERAHALTKAESREKRSTVFKLGVGIGAVALIALAGGIYALSRSGAGGGSRADGDLEMYKRGEIEVSGSAGILPAPKPGARRSGKSSGGSGSGLSYEDAMMQAVDLGSSATGGGEQQLSAATVAGVMNNHLNQLYGACVRGNPGKIKVDIAIAGSGQVIGVSVDGGEGGLQRCVADQVRKIHFPSFSAPRMGARYSFGS